jgi:hypothetical protein
VGAPPSSFHLFDDGPLDALLVAQRPLHVDSHVVALHSGVGNELWLDPNAIQAAVAHIAFKDIVPPCIDSHMHTCTA